MTDLPHSPDDELVSAVLDGEATDDERARVHVDPRLSARLEELASIRDRVSEPVRPLDEVTARRLVDRAVAEAASVETRTSGVPAAGAPAPRRRRRRPDAMAILSAVAAAVVLLLLAVPLVATLGDGTDDDAAMDAQGGDEAESAGDTAENGTSAAGESADEMTTAPDRGGAADGGDAAGEESHADPARPFAPADASVRDLGAFDDAEELAAAARSTATRTDDDGTDDDRTEATDGDDREGDASSATGREHLGCLDAPGQQVLLHGSATLAERPVEFRVRSEDGGAVVEVLDAETCALVHTSTGDGSTP